MKLTVLGATGGTGRILVEQALAAGHTVTALVRDPQKLTLHDQNLRVVTGSATDVAAVSRALEGADALVSTLGGGGPLIEHSTAAIVEAARTVGVKRVVMLSTFAVERDRMDVVTRTVTGLGMGSMIKDKVLGERLLRDSGLDWTIAYASVLTDGPASGSVKVVPDGGRRTLGQRISRADVAAWMLNAAADEQHTRRGVGITG
jgi:uncharacterized protein YbjT (DUF2867 family)